MGHALSIGGLEEESARLHGAAARSGLIKYGRA